MNEIKRKLQKYMYFICCIVINCTKYIFAVGFSHSFNYFQTNKPLNKKKTDSFLAKKGSPICQKFAKRQRQAGTQI